MGGGRVSASIGACVIGSTPQEFSDSLAINEFHCMNCHERDEAILYMLL